MQFINIFELMFMISLGITFILILVMVYYFKKRIAGIDEKCDTMFEIITDIVTEFENIKPDTNQPPIHNMHMQPPVNLNTNDRFNEIHKFTMPMSMQMGSLNKIQVVLSYDDDWISIIEDSYDEEEDDSDNDSDGDSDSEDDIDIDINCDIITDDASIKLVHLDNISQSDVINLDNTITIQQLPIESIDLDNDLDKTQSNGDIYKKMTIQQLRQMVIEKGLLSDPSKVKKHELTKLLLEWIRKHI